MTAGPQYRRKLIEVALPLAEINDASAYDKMPGIGPHPKGIHQWWARLPLPTARAVLVASVVKKTVMPQWPIFELLLVGFRVLALGTALNSTDLR